MKDKLYSETRKELAQFVAVVLSLSLYPTLRDTMECSMPGFLVLHHLPSLLKLMSIESVTPSNHLILCHPLLLLPSVFPSIRIFSNQLTFLIR